MKPMPIIHLFIASCLAAAAKEVKTPAPLEGAETLIYKEASDTKLILNVFYPKGHNPKKDKRPAIVFFFGGGWNGGNPGQFRPHCLYLASRGMVAMTADYRVKSRQGTSPFECVKDGKSAVRWIRANAKKLGVDPKETCVYACGHPQMIEDVGERMENTDYNFIEERFWKEDE